MRIIITGTPGTGKTTVAKVLARRLKSKYINEHTFCMKQGIGRIEKKSGELVVSLAELQKALKRVLAKEKDFVLEGHLVCEIKLPVDLAIVLTCDSKELEKRLKRKHYSDEKILDNLHCERTGYCLRKALESFGKKKVLLVDCGKGIKKSLPPIIKAFEITFSEKRLAKKSTSCKSLAKKSTSCKSLAKKALRANGGL